MNLDFIDPVTFCFSVFDSSQHAFRLLDIVRFLLFSRMKNKMFHIYTFQISTHNILQKLQINKMVNGCFFNFRHIVSLEFIDMYFCFFQILLCIHYTVQKFGSVRFLNVFEKSLLCSPRLHLCNKKSKKL